MKNLSLIKKGFNVKSFSTATSVQPWVDRESRIAKLRSELVLAEHSQMENYVLNLVKNYHRTTNKDAVTKNAVFSDHGLDSLDSIELCMQMEDELGYIVEAETISRFTKVKHLINFVNQMELYKRQHKTLPQFRAQEYTENWDDWLPKGEVIKAKLFGYTKEGENKAKH